VGGKGDRGTEGVNGERKVKRGSHPFLSMPLPLMKRGRGMDRKGC